MEKILVVEENGTVKVLVSKAFEKASHVYGSEEYRLLRQVKAENPGCEVEIKSKDKKTYAKLTYEKMEREIKMLENSDALLCEFQAVRKFAKAIDSGYPLVKKWYLAKIVKQNDEEAKKILDASCREAERIKRFDKQKGEIVDLAEATQANAVNE